MKLDSSNIMQFIHDLRFYQEQDDLDTANKMVASFRETLKPYGKKYTKQVLTYAEKAFDDTDPTKQSDAINQVGHLLDNPKEFFTAKPTGEGSLKAGGKAFLGGMVAPFAKGPGKERFQQWKQSQSKPHPFAVGGGEMLGRAIPDIVMQATLGKLPGIQALGPTVKGAVTGAGAGAGMGGAEGGLQGAIQGGISGGAGAATGGILTNKFLPAASRQDIPTQELITKQREAGYWASPGLQTGRKSAEQLDMAIKKQMATANIMQEHLDLNRAKLNETLAKELGMPEGTSVLDIDTLKQQNDVLNQKLDNFYKEVKPHYQSNDKAVFGKVKTSYKNATGLELPREYANFEKRLKFLMESPSAGKAAVNKTDALRNLTRDLSRRATFHFTDPNGNRELGKVYREMLGTAESGVTRTVGKKRKSDWDAIRSQQGLLLDLVAKDSGLLSTGKVTPSTLRRVIEKGGTHNLSYINKRRNLWDATRFVQRQENAFENSLAANQRLGHYIQPWKHQGGGMKQVMAEATKGVPGIRGLGIEQYLNARHMRNAADETKYRAAQLVGGAVGAQSASKVPSLDSLLGVTPSEAPPTVTRPIEAEEKAQLLEQANTLPNWYPRELLPVPQPDPWYKPKGTYYNQWNF